MGSLPYVVFDTMLIAQIRAHTKALSITDAHSHTPSFAHPVLIACIKQAQYWNAALGYPSQITPTAYADSHPLSGLPSIPKCEL